jgi:hypothetical protein
MLRKTWIFLVIPVVLSLLLYLLPPLRIGHEEDILNSYWSILMYIIMLYYCQLRIGLSIKKSTFAIVFFAYYILLLSLIALMYFNSNFYGKFQTGVSRFISVVFEFIFYYCQFFLFPFCVFKIKHLFRFTLIFIKKNIILVIPLLLLYFIIDWLLDMARDSSFVKSFFLSAYINFVSSLKIIIYPVITIVVYKNRKKLKILLVKLLKRVLNKPVPK